MSKKENSSLARQLMNEAVARHGIAPGQLTPLAETRVIAPHTLAFTGMRWHVRAWCEKNQAFRDFVLSRFRGIQEVIDDTSPMAVEQDLAWNTLVEIVIEPDSRLSHLQQQIAGDLAVQLVSLSL